MKKVFILLFVLLSACSTGSNHPDLSVIKRQKFRSTIDKEMGDPVSIKRSRDGSYIAVYEFNLGDGKDEADTDMLMADGNLWIAFLMTGAHLSSSEDGDTFEAIVTYNTDDSVRHVSSRPKPR